MLTPDFAIWEGAIEIAPTGGRPSMKGFAVDVMKRVGDAWLILETHPKIFPTIPS
jgi:hypothetical protein